MRGVAEGFRPALASGGKCAGEIAIAQAVFDFGAANELVEKSGVKTVAGANGIHSFDFGCGSSKGFLSLTRQDPFFAALDDQERNFPRKFFRSGD